MKHRYLPMTKQDKQEMLDFIGVKSIDELFSDIPEQVRFKRDYNLPPALSETELLLHMKTLAGKNTKISDYKSYLGAGAYEHFKPAIVDQIISRSEFYTAYTPYQAEISQGELQAIFEFQTMMCELTGMDVANSSMYDGGTAAAEAAMLATSHTRRRKIIVSDACAPEAKEILKLNAYAQNKEIIILPSVDGVTDHEKLRELLDIETACVIVQYPNFFGRIEDLAAIKKVVEENKSLLIVSSNPLALGALQPPGAFGADIVVGDVQPFGIPVAFGGPHCGYFAVTEKLMRKIPGRLVGQTVDSLGKRGFVLTLQAREQHIRRDKATSNICSNQSLNALAAAVFLSVMGKSGLEKMSKQNIYNAHYAKQALKKAGFEIVFDGACFNEFIVKCDMPIETVNKHLLAPGIIGGYNLEKDYPELKNCMLVFVSELHTKKDIENFANEMRLLKCRN